MSGVLKSLILRLKSSSFFKDLCRLWTGTTAAQFILLAASPFLTRLYTPEAFGLFSVFVSIISILLPFSTLKYETAIVVPKLQRHAEQLKMISLFISACFCIFLLGLITLFKDFWLSLFNVDLSSVIYYIPFCTLFFSVGLTFNFYYTRIGRFNVLSFSKVLQSVTTVLLQIGSGMVVMFKSGGLVLGYMLGHLASNIFLLFHARKTLVFMSLKKGVATIRRYRDFPKHLVITSVADSLALQAPVLLFAKFFTPMELGLFALASRIVFTPLSAIIASVSQVFLNRAAELHRNGQSSFNLMKKSLLLLFSIAFPFFLFLLFFGPTFFSMFFGSDWVQSGHYAQLLAFIFLIRFSVSPLTGIFSLTQTLHISAAWKYTYFFTTYIVLGGAAILSQSVEMFLRCFVIHDLILYSIYLFFALSASKKGHR